MPKSHPWTKPQLILALNLYLKLPFGKLHSKTPEIIHLANLIGRTPGAVAMRLTNFASVDPYHQKRGIKGLEGGYKQVKPIWDEFEEDREQFIFESEKLLASYENRPLESKYKDSLKNISGILGETRLSQVKTRVNQRVFRELVLANYENRCAVSGINISKLLIASHIIPWAENAKERLNPENGICLSPLYDKAFDDGFMGIDNKYKILISKRFEKEIDGTCFEKFFKPYMGAGINLPKKYLPGKEFLEEHLEKKFLN